MFGKEESKYGNEKLSLKNCLPKIESAPILV